MGSSEGRPADTKYANIKYWNDINKAPDDKRNYRGLELSNGLKILLVSDPDTEKSAAALDVKVGSLSDPIDMPGMAHFCEHMIFLGTEKYPDPNDFLKYITAHGGHHNATTLSDHTVYYFDIMPQFFKPALDRFAQFFIAPLFNKECAVKEVNAIDSEFEKNYVKDFWRLDQLERHTSKLDHPYRKFPNGNIESLVTLPMDRGLNIHDELRAFHHKWYSANIMTAAILGKESLNQLEIMAVQLFANVPNRNAEDLEWKVHPFGPEQLKVIGYVVPKKNIRTLHISFPTPDFEGYYRTKPFNYISSLIGHEGPGSLHSALRGRGWSDRLVSGARIGGKGFGFFYIKLDLTEQGIEKIDDIVKLCFQYVKMMNVKGPQKWFFDEHRSILEAAYRFKEKEQPYSYVTNLVKDLHMYPFEEVLRAPFVIDSWDTGVIQKFLDLIEPNNMRLIVVGRKFENVVTRKEPWFGTKYKLEKIPDGKIQEWENCSVSDELSLPKRNNFIPDNFIIFPKRESYSHPVIIKETPLLRVWYKRDEEFLLPKAYMNLEIFNPLAYVDPLFCNLTRMFTHLVEDELNEYSYDADLAGLGWEIRNTEYGIMVGVDQKEEIEGGVNEMSQSFILKFFQLSVGGYNDKQAILLNKILDTMISLKIKPQRFEIIKEKYVRSLLNFDLQQPHDQTTYYLSVLISDFAWTMDELVAAAEEMTLKQLVDFVPQLFSRLFVECLIHGNVSNEKAQEIISIVEDKFNPSRNVKPLRPQQLLRRREIQLFDGANYNLEIPNEHCKSSCTEIYYQCNVQSTRNNMLIELLVQIMIEPTFATLRNEEQLGYMVSSGIRRSNSCQGLRVVLQSDKHPLYLDQRIEALLIKVRDIIVDMLPSEFKQHKEALANILLEKPKTMACQTRRYWREITLQQYNFNRVHHEVSYLRTISKLELLEFFDTYISYDAPMRRKLTVHIVSYAEDGAGKLPHPDIVTLNSSIDDSWVLPPPFIQPNKIEDITIFKRNHGVWPLVKPYANLSSFRIKS